MLSIAEEKKALRLEVLSRTDLLSSSERSRFSRAIALTAINSEAYQQAKSISCFRSMKNEVDTQELIADAWASGRQVALPITPAIGLPLSFRWVGPQTRLRRRAYGALEPDPDASEAVSFEDIEVWFVPGVAFDTRGARLGQGGAYYDRTLVKAGPAIMLAFDCQQVAAVPEEAHDRRVNAVITESGSLLSST